MDRPIPTASDRASDTPDALCPATPATQAQAGAPALVVLRRLRPSPFTLGGGCRWIEGDVRAPEGPRFCDAPRERRRPYCRAHCLRAYAGLQSISAETMRAALGLEPIDPPRPGPPAREPRAADGAPQQAPEHGAAGRDAPAGHSR